MQGFNGLYEETYSLYTYTPFRKTAENFDTTTQVNINKNINQINGLKMDMSNNDALMQSNFADISNNLQKYYDTANYLSSNNSKYHYDDKQSSQEIMFQSSPKDIKYVVHDDINQLKLYQNSVYISGVLACATLLIAVILMGRK
jgi:hypothetical protein